MNVPRRGIFRAVFGSALGMGCASLGAVAGLWSAAVVRFMVPNVTAEAPSTFKAGRPADYREGYVETKYRQTHGVWVVHGVYQGRPQLFALRTACTHLGCITVWQESQQKFKCPCHGSGFSKEGINIEGPAPRPLERCAIRVADDGQLEIDRSRIFQQQRGEWEDSESYLQG